ncbi:MAG: 2-dehydropantoate 2-reductase [Aggregatilineales bacterium]|nr:2-dehydropantoate 2-reductase [Chloroflexota bacterium]HOA23593.1 2-dehydropantoate 2-reductase [Aggregatilineales bacterium]HPV05524.1 2-dehydropantoate 2-reductase [Aggregatilineales bacterium]
MRIAIFGVGAMGCLFGARLSPHAEVTLVGHWPEQIAALQRQRLRIIHPDRRDEFADLQATNSIDSLEPVDIALILTKSSGTEAAARSAAKVLAPDGIAITLQNGLGNLEILAEHVGADRATLGVTTEGASIDRPGVLRYGGRGATHLSTRPEINGHVQAFAELLQKGGMAARVLDDVSGLVWGKLAVNAAINPLTAVLGVTNGMLLESEAARSLMAAAAREVAAVAAAHGITLPFDDAAARAEDVAGLTATNRSSMLQDIERGVPTEIEVISGAVVRAGEAKGVPTPVNAVLYRLVKTMEELAVIGRG